METVEGDENMKKINMINNMLEDNKRKLTNGGINERKTVEELNNAANYFDMSKKHTRKKNFNDIIYSLFELFMKKIKETNMFLS